MFKGLPLVSCSDSIFAHLGSNLDHWEGCCRDGCCSAERLQQDEMWPKSPYSISLPHSSRLPTRQHTEAEGRAIFTLALWQSQSSRTPWPRFTYEAWASLPFYKTAWIMECTILLTYMWNCIGTICINRAVANCKICTQTHTYVGVCVCSG